MFSMPHQQPLLQPNKISSNQLIVDYGCTPSIHGTLCPVIGGSWSLVDELYDVSFYAPRPVKEEMIPALQEALRSDIGYQLPWNYQKGAGDTYFSGKMMAKLARILLIADQVGGVDQLNVILPVLSSPQFFSAIYSLVMLV